MITFTPITLYFGKRLITQLNVKFNNPVIAFSNNRKITNIVGNKPAIFLADMNLFFFSAMSPCC